MFFRNIVLPAVVVTALLLAHSPRSAASAEPASRPAWYASVRPGLSSIWQENFLLQALDARASGQEQDARAAAALPDPVLGLGLQAVPTDFDLDREPMTQRPMLSLRQVIPAGNGRRAKRRAGRAAAAAIRSDREARAEDLAADLTASLFDWVRTEAELRAVSETIAWDHLLLESARIRYRSGRGMAHDVAQLEVEIARLDAQYSDLRAQAETARLDWLRILGQEPPTTALSALTEPEGAWQVSDELTTVVLAASPRLHRLEALRTQAEATVRLNRAGWTPDLIVEGGWGVRGAGRRDFLTGRLGLSVPLWGRWSQRPRVEAAEARLQAIQAEIDDLRRTLIARTRTLLARHRDLVRREQIYDATILPQARFARTSARAAYEGGGVDVFVPIEATARYLRAERERDRLLAMRRAVEARLLAIAGGLAPQPDTHTTSATYGEPR